jgi:hypothetical protein
MSTASRTRAEARFESAIKGLNSAIPTETSQYSKLSFPNLSGVDNIDNVEDTAKALGGFLERLIQQRKEVSNAKPTRKKKFQDVMLGWFRASYPFAKLVLEVTKEGVAVFSFASHIADTQMPVLNPYGLLCAGLLALLKVLERFDCLLPVIDRLRRVWKG